MIKRFTKYFSERRLPLEYVNEELDAVTVGMVGNGTAVTGYPTGSWTTSAGVSVYGGDSDSAFAGNASNTKSMEQEVVVPPKTMFKEPRKKRNKKDKKERPYNQIGANIDAVHKPFMKVNEEAKIKDMRTLICRVENKAEIFSVIDKIKRTFPNIDSDYNSALNDLNVFPNWLFIDMTYFQTEIFVNYWGDTNDYDYNLSHVTNRLQNSYGMDRHMYNYSELSDIIVKIKSYFDILSAPNYNPRKTTRTLENKLNEEFYYSQTVVCKFDTLEEAHTIIDRITKISTDLTVNYNESMDENLSVFPNWLFMDLSHNKNDIYINYWGNHYRRHEVEAEIRRSIARDDYDHHMYTYGELNNLVTKIKGYFGIPNTPDYTPKRIKRTLENNNDNMKTFNEFSKLNEDEGSGGVASATLGNTSGMGAIVAAQPSSIPGDVAGSTIGSGDISRGTPLGPYTKISQRKSNKRKKKDKSARKYNQLGSSIDNFYVTKYAQATNDGKFIQSWQTFTDTK